MDVVSIELEDAHLPPLAKASAPTEVQPGGGFAIDLEAAWGRVRRALLRTLRPGYVRRMAAKRQGHCEGCRHDIIDARDLKLCRNVCGYWFRPEDDRFRWRDRLGFARYGLAELLVCTFLFALYVAATAALAYALHDPIWWSLLAPALITYLHVPWFFRDPRRTPPDDRDALLSPADGVVTHIDQVDAPGFPGGRAARISIYLSVWNVHLNRMPRRARMVSSRYFPGEFLTAMHPDCVQRNEQLWVDFEEPGGRPLRLKQVSGAMARRLVCWLRPGEEVAAGERFGMIKFGSRTDVLWPIADAHQLHAKVGDVVHAGTSILLRFTPPS